MARTPQPAGKLPRIGQRPDFPKRERRGIQPGPARGRICGQNMEPIRVILQGIEIAAQAVKVMPNVRDIQSTLCSSQ